jgi:hypothetical protein
MIDEHNNPDLKRSAKAKEPSKNIAVTADSSIQDSSTQDITDLNLNSNSVTDEFNSKSSLTDR